MNSTLAIAYDEFGLRTMIDNYIAQVRHHPDPQALARYTNPILKGNPGPLYKNPGPAQLLRREIDGDERCQKLYFQVNRWAPNTAPQNLVAHHYRTDVNARAKHTVIVLHGGLVGIDPRGLDRRPYQKWCRELNALGLDALFVELPFHMSRTPEGRFSGELFVSGDLIRTLDTVCQSVSEIRALISWMELEDLPSPGLLGFSLGGLVSTQVLSTDKRIQFAALLAPVPEPARTFDESLLGQALHPDWCHPGLTREDLIHLFNPVRPLGFTPCIDPKDILLIAARYDQTIDLDDMKAMQKRWNCSMAIYDMGHFALPTHRKVNRQTLFPFLQQYAS